MIFTSVGKSKTLDFKYSDGGRSRYFKAENVGDCVCRALAIVTKKDYMEVYEAIRKITNESPRDGVKGYKEVLEAFGGKWHSTMSTGTGCKVHLNKSDLPTDKTIICRVSKHLTAVVNGVIYDTFDPSRNGTRCVYGFWEF